MQFSEIRTEVFRRLDESEASPQFWTVAQVDQAINEGYEEMSDSSEWYEVSESVSLVADQSYYDLWSLLTYPFLALRRIQNAQTSRWLDATHYREMDETNVSSWQQVSGQPQYWLMRGLWHMGVFPRVSSTAGTLTVKYTGIPAALSADGDTPGFPQEFHPGLIDYALYDLLVQEGESKKALRYWKRFVGYDRALRAYVSGRMGIADKIVVGAY